MEYDHRRPLVVGPAHEVVNRIPSLSTPPGLVQCDPHEQRGSRDRVVRTSLIRGEPAFRLIEDVAHQKHGGIRQGQAADDVQDVIRRAPDLTVLMTADGTLRYPYPAVEDVLGHRGSDLIGIPVVDLVHPDDLPQFTEALATLRRQPSVELRFRCSDDSWRHLRATMCRLAGDTHAAAFVLNAREATVRQHRAAKLLQLAAASEDCHHRNESRWWGEGVEHSSADWISQDGPKVEVAVDSVPICDDGGRIIAGSRIFNGIAERARIAELLRQMDNEMECRVEERTIGLTVANTRLKSQLAEREQAQEDLEEQVAALRDQVKLLERAHHAILVRDFATGTVLSWNSGAEEMYGWAKDEVVGRVCDDLLQTRLPQPAAEMEIELLRMGHWEGELEQTRRAGDRIVVECRWVLQRDERGQPAAILESNRDITMRRQAEEERAVLLATAQEYSSRLADLAVLKADFTAMVAHELGSPIAAICSLADMLTRTELPPDDQGQALAMIRNEAKVLHTLVHDVQAIASAERNDFTIHLQPVPVAVLLADAAAFNQTLPGRHQLVTLITTHRLVRADRERVGQVLRNLIGNAAKYSPDNSPIELRTSQQGDRIRIEVVDHGPGIHPDDLPRIFEKFARGREGRGRRRPGTGLGLYLSRRIARGHGGDLTVESTQGLGSVFGFELEIVQ